jgi:CBS-domain-containing membrane protein/nucleotide-binding universal stress UspA family protein
MFRHVLVAYDGSDGAEAALRLAIDLARRTRAELATVSVEEPPPRYAETIAEVEETQRAAEAHFHQLTKHARDLALLDAVDLDPVIRQGHEVGVILDVVRERGVDLLVIGYQGHSRVFERIIGSTASSVARLAPCSVWLMRLAGASGPRLPEIQRILVGLDGSPLGRLAFQAALDLAALTGGTVVGVTIREVPAMRRPETVDWAGVEQLQAAAEEHARAAGVPFVRIARAGHAAETLAEEARRQAAHLLVLGATGLEHPWSPTMGGTAARLASEAPCSVLLVRPPPAVLHVRDVMVRGISSVTPETPVGDVVALLLRRNVKALPVVDGRRPVVGIITGGDLIRRGGLALRLSLKRDLDDETLRQRLVEFARSRTLARAVMTHPVHTIEADVDLRTAIRLMAERRLKRLPVVDREAVLAGLVSRADVLRTIAALPEPPEAADRRLPQHARTVGEITTTDVPSVSPDSDAETVLERLVEHPLRRVVVVGADGRVLGIVSDRDLLLRTSPDSRPWLVRALTGRRAALGPAEPGRRGFAPGAPLTARALMAPSLVTVRSDEPLRRAIQLMMQHRVKRLVVIDQAGRLVGLVDRRDLLRSLAEEPASPEEL